MESASVSGPPILELGDRSWPLGARSGVMGILNATPDSFSDGGLFSDADSAIRRGEQLALEGADIVDVGGESTRPGFKPVSAEEEIRRVKPVIEALACKTGFPPLSIDTSKAEVARAALDAGARIVNEIWGFRKSPELAEIVADRKASCALMHNSREGWLRESTLDSVKASWEESIGIALKAGIPENRIILDPGIGFTDTRIQDVEIMNGIGELRRFGFPILIGVSRKRIAGEVLGLDVDQRLETSLALAALALDRGADFIRVHDVEENVRVARSVDMLSGN